MLWKLLAPAQCSGTTANSVTGGINSSVLILNTDPGRRLLTSSLYNILDARDKSVAGERSQGGCVGCVRRTEHSHTSLMNILNSSLLYEGEEK